MNANYNVEKVEKSGEIEEIKKPKSAAAATLGRRRWKVTGDDPREIGRKGGLAKAKSGNTTSGGRPRVPTACPKCQQSCIGWREAQTHCRKPLVHG